ncbi:MAG: hypothetical protein HQM14_00565 [SAR324 cluster bacterium]|nr:hypothetical protein [SAR324 cluster bacterium]
MHTFNYQSIFTLGPPGTFSDEVAQKLRSASTSIIYTRTFAEALIQLSHNANTAAVVPIENSVAGIVAQVQELLVREDLIIVAEINLKVCYALLASSPLDQVVTHYAHPQALEQTSDFIARHLPVSNIEFSHSNVDSGVQFLNSLEQKKCVAAIVPLSFADKHPEYIHSKDIQDYKNNTTRFFIVQKKKNSDAFDFTQQKTSLFVEFKEDRSGLLYELLSIFNQFDINLCRLESRPSKETPWFYVFYVDFTNNEQTQACIDSLQNSFFRCKVLGSYNLIPS